MKNIIQYSLAVATLLVLNAGSARAAGSVKTTSDVIEISTGIPAGHAITVWFCVRTFLTAGSFDCVRATGHIVGADGKVSAAGAVKVGDASESISPTLGTDGLGLLDPFGDFVVLVVRDHGPAIPGQIPDQIHSYQPVCGPCTDAQVSFHPVP